MNVQETAHNVRPDRKLRLVHAPDQVARRLWRMAGLLALFVPAYFPPTLGGAEDVNVSTVEILRTDAAAGDVLVQGIVVDAQTGQPLEAFRVLPGVPYGREAEGQDPACATWQPHLIREGAEGAFEWPRERTYPLFQLRIEADGYVPVTSDWITKDEATWVVSVKMLRDPGVRGRVLTPAGEPAAGATFAIGLPNRAIRLDGKKIARADEPLPDKLGDRWRRPVIVTADEQGRLTLPTETDPAAMLCILHDSGYLERPFSQFLADYRDAADVFQWQLAAWGHIAGEVVWKDRPGANEPIFMSIMRENIYPELIASFRSVQSNAGGRFEFANVPPGPAQLSRSVKLSDEDSGSYQFPHAHVEVKPGPPTVAIIGGRGVPVVGELAGLDSYNGITVRIQPRAPHIGFPGDDVIWKGYAAVQASEIGPLYFREPMPVNEDGTFRIEAVLPGDYQLFIANEDKSVYKVHSVQVPTEHAATRADQPLDFGRIEVAERAATAAEPAPQAAPPVKPQAVTVRGTVVDDETGNPVEGFIVQAGKFDPAEPAKVTWGFSETRTTSKNPRGAYSTAVRWSEGWTARILADGYLPQPVLAEAPPEGTETLEVTIRLKRGRLISGRVLDHLGRPVPGATVFAAGRGINLYSGKAYGHDDEEDHSRVGVRTDDLGGFEVAAGDSTRLAVSCEALDAWAADIPENGDAVAIVLPEPARVEIVYDIAGSDEAGEVFYQFLSHYVPELKGVETTRRLPIENGGRLELASLPPGKYQFCRYRMLRYGSMGTSAMLDRMFIELAPGEKRMLEFVRTSGAPVRGTVTWPEGVQLDGIIVSIDAATAEKNPFDEHEYTTTFDRRLAGKYEEYQLQGTTAEFLTERIAPGRYVVRADGYAPLSEEQRFRSGRVGPSHTATATIEVPEEGDPPLVELRLEAGRGGAE